MCNDASLVQGDLPITKPFPVHNCSGHFRVPRVLPGTWPLEKQEDALHPTRLPWGYPGRSQGKPVSLKGHSRPHSLQGSSRTGIVMRTGSFLYLCVPLMPGPSSAGSHLCPRLTYEREGVFLAVPSQEVAAASGEAVHALIKGVYEVTSKEAAAGHRRLAISPLCAKSP